MIWIKEATPMSVIVAAVVMADSQRLQMHGLRN
jgi:hypothetical protein